ncbi:hypothetical protein M0R45_001553 [Rubus argutus]|uniref:CCHC-type domain-containing protein n=1 Tax=Rubus argutus TaxID=59490 RepID=A0AAW1VL76_RUBAR
MPTKVEAQLDRPNTRQQFSGKGLLPTPEQSIGKVVSRSYSPQNLVSQEPGTSQTKSTGGVNNAKAAPANPYAPPPPVKCYRCGQPGHRSNQCPQCNVHLTVHDGNENEILQEAEDDLQDNTEVTYEDEGISLVVRKLIPWLWRLMAAWVLQRRQGVDGLGFWVSGMAVQVRTVTVECEWQIGMG